MSPVFWIIIGVLALLLLGGGNSRKKPASRDGATRIDRMHYYEPDDCECSVCGARFGKKSMVCPKCGAKFSAAKEDDGEFIEELDFWEDDEENN